MRLVEPTVQCKVCASKAKNSIAQV